jgi:mono/diheme cytochrome c family protein
VRLLSSRRRHPAAKALLLVAGLFLMGALYSVIAPPAKVLADTGNSQQIAEGKALFAVGCASCHGLNGEGQVGENIQGPPLAGVGAAAVDFQVSSGRMPMARPGEQAAVKPPTYSEEEIAAPRGVRSIARPRARQSQNPPLTTRRTSARRTSHAAASYSAPTARPATTSRAPAAHFQTASTRHR